MDKPQILGILFGLIVCSFAAAQTREFGYDGVGRLVEVRSGEKGRQTFSYDVEGNLLSMLQDSDGDSLSDEFERLIIERVSNDRFVAFIDVLPTDDFDEDGITNLEEFEQLSDPAEGVVTFLRGYDRFLVTAFDGEADPAVVGLEADPDQDGFSNLEEYIHHRDPTKSDGGALVVSSREGQRLQVTVILRANDDQLVHFAEISSDLQNWLRIDLQYIGENWSLESLAPFVIAAQEQLLPGAWRLTLREVESEPTSDTLFLRIGTEVVR